MNKLVFLKDEYIREGVIASGRTADKKSYEREACFWAREREGKGGVQDSTQARTGLGGAVQIGQCSFLQAAGTPSTEKVRGEACLGRSPVGSGSQTWTTP